jgi:hypothetical protein
LEHLSLGTTAFNDAARCLKKYEYRWVLGLVPPPREVRPTLRRGVWLHRCLELLDRGEEWTPELERMAMWGIENHVEPESIEQTTLEVRDLVEDYWAYWLGHERDMGIPGPWTTVDTEFKACWSPRPELDLTSTVDILKRDGNGRLWIWERKSTMEIPDSDWRTVDPQTMLQFIELRNSGVDVAGIIFDYICTRPGAQLRVTKEGRLYKGDEERRTRARYFKATEAELRGKGAAEEYIEQVRMRTVSDGEWFQRFPTMRPDANAELTLKDVASTIRSILDADKQGYYARSINVLDCRLFCPYGKLCMHEYQLGHDSPAMREEYTVQTSDDLYSMGRSDW